MAGIGTKGMSELDRFFHPDSIAVIAAQRTSTWKRTDGRSATTSSLDARIILEDGAVKASAE